VKGSRQVGCTEPGSGMRQGGGEGHDRDREVADRQAGRQAHGAKAGRWHKAGRCHERQVAQSKQIVQGM
jgi:hypothetical protein